MRGGSSSGALVPLVPIVSLTSGLPLAHKSELCAVQCAMVCARHTRGGESEAAFIEV